jgi:hypothetical protein
LEKYSNAVGEVFQRRWNNLGLGKMKKFSKFPKKETKYSKK